MTPTCVGEGSRQPASWIKYYLKELQHVGTEAVMPELTGLSEHPQLRLEFMPIETLSQQALDCLILYFIYRKHLVTHKVMEKFLEKHGGSNDAKELFGNMLQVLFKTVNDLEVMVKQELESNWSNTYAMHSEETSSTIRNVCYQNIVGMYCCNPDGSYHSDPCHPAMQFKINELMEETARIFGKARLAYSDIIE